ncbi:LANO_0F11518g1_1 [Lachancea nothofagi CBS 11611]|uniref:LANO_0F11518g1_1 n=1 Tax=Lachancea nothofagi CBS 11611 TaxID=1266666 RepID=A0A1G4KAV7_9SACH|nr:LANO_0F11518g1_1 [Lachancea nothofagi CBS 11611]
MNYSEFLRVPSSPPEPASNPAGRSTGPSFDQSPSSPLANQEFDLSVAEKLQHDRQCQYQSVRQPFSSPLKDTGRRSMAARSRHRRRSWQSHRHRTFLENRALVARGGADQMEQDVIALERDAELQQLAAQAQLHHIDADEVDDEADGIPQNDDRRGNENDADDDDDDDDGDDDLVVLLQERDHYENMLMLEQQLLEEAMASFTITDDE